MSTLDLKNVTVTREGNDVRNTYSHSRRIHVIIRQMESDNVFSCHKENKVFIKSVCN